MIYFIVILIVLLAILIIYLKSPRARGKRGENMVKWVIGNTIENQQYIINNLIIKNGEKTSQIDHIVINPHGVFVIETKNISGKIYGSEKQLKWTQVLAYGKRKNKLYNLIMQNETHVFYVKKIIGKLPVHSLVVFVQNNTEEIDIKNVIPLTELESSLQEGENVLSVEEMKFAYETLLANRAKIPTRKHVKNIKLQQYKLEHGICPRCGGNLVLRDGKNGKFWGCSKYPKCKFTKNDL